MAFLRGFRRSRWLGAVLTSLLAMIAVLRIVSTYPVTAQAFDEPCHLGTGMEFLERHTYMLDTVHPPLARIAIALPLYLAGEPYPTLSAEHKANCNDVGNAILYDSNRYLRNLELARLGVLPFFLLATALVFLWARREYGDFGGVMAAALFTTLPNVLALSSIAYTDMAAAATQLAALFAFTLWLERRTTNSAVVLAFALSLALLAKFTTGIFFPAAALMIAGTKWVTARRQKPEISQPLRSTAKQFALISVIVVLCVWAGYGFSVGHIREAAQVSTNSLPTFDRFPRPVADIGRRLVLSDAEVPAPALLKGISMAWLRNQEQSTGYLFGKIKKGGWWYFFLTGVAVKSPLPFLILALAGVLALKSIPAPQRWHAMAPAASALAVLLVTMPVKYNAGVRHVLVVFPLLAISAGLGCSVLWQTQGKPRLAARLALAGLLCWQGVATVRARHDFIAYFNELAGSDPSKVLVAGCDLDCGQDLFRLSREFQLRHISHATIAVWTSAEPDRANLPDFDVPQAYRPVAGWFAISLRALRFGDSFHTTYPPGAFDWLHAYQPVDRVGKTILLYYIPEDALAGTKPASEPQSRN